MTRGPGISDVAKACGVSHSTVSRALHNHPSIPPATRERIAAAARKLGYRPDSKLTQLMAHVRRGRAPGYQSTLALVHLAGHAETERSMRHQWNYVEGARQRAESLGYGLVDVYVEAQRLTGRDVTRILRARGIEGAVLIGGTGPVLDAGVDWSIAAWATVGFFAERPPLHAAAADYAAHAMECVERLAARGCRRIAFVQSVEAALKIGHEWLAGYAAGVLRRGARPLVFSAGDRFLAGLDRWLRETKPDGIVSHTSQVDRSLDRIQPWPAVAMVNLGGDDERKCGIVEKSREAGVSAVDLVVGQLLRGERGLPEFPKKVLIRGTWVEATPMRASRPGRRGAQAPARYATCA